MCRVSAAWRGCYGLKCESASVRKLIDFVHCGRNSVSAPHKASCLFRLCSDRNRGLVAALRGVVCCGRLMDYCYQRLGSHVGGLLFCSPLRAPFLH